MRDEQVLIGGCACGSVRFVARGAPLRVGLCHCMTCRKAHAAAFNPFVVFPRDQVEIVGELRGWQSTSDYERRFCPECGSRVFGGRNSLPEIEISLGSFDDVGRVEPQYESWVIRREPWSVALNIPQHDRDRPDE